MTVSEKIEKDLAQVALIVESLHKLVTTHVVNISRNQHELIQNLACTIEHAEQNRSVSSPS